MMTNINNLQSLVVHLLCCLCVFLLLSCDNKPTLLIGQSLTFYSPFEGHLKIYSHSDDQWVSLGYFPKDQTQIYVQLPNPPWSLEINQVNERILLTEINQSHIDLSFLFYEKINRKTSKLKHPLTALSLEVAPIEDLTSQTIAISEGEVFKQDETGILRAPIHQKVVIISIWQRENRTIYYAMREIPDLYFYQNQPLAILPQKTVKKYIPIAGVVGDLQLAMGEWVYQGTRTGLIVDQGLVNADYGLLVSVPEIQAENWGIWLTWSPKQISSSPFKQRDENWMSSHYVEASELGVQIPNVQKSRLFSPSPYTLEQAPPFDESTLIEWQVNEDQSTYLDIQIYDISHTKSLRILAPSQGTNLQDANLQDQFKSLKLPPSILDEWTNTDLIEILIKDYTLSGLEYEEIYGDIREHQIIDVTLNRDFRQYQGYLRSPKPCLLSSELGYYLVNGQMGCLADQPIFAIIDQCGSLSYEPNAKIRKDELTPIEEGQSIRFSELLGHYYALRLYEKTADQEWKLSVSGGLEGGPWLRISADGKIWIENHRFSAAGVMSDLIAGVGKGWFFKCNQAEIPFDLTWDRDIGQLTLNWQVEDRFYQAEVRRWGF